MAPQRKYPEGGGIYSITNRINGRVYYGRGTFSQRWGSHLSQLRAGTHFNAALQADWFRYGEDAFWFRVVEIIKSDDQRNAEAIREHFYIWCEAKTVYNCDNGSKWWRNKAA